MRKLIRLLVPFVMKSDRLSQPLDVRFITGQEMPAILSAGAEMGLAGWKHGAGGVDAAGEEA